MADSQAGPNRNLRRVVQELLTSGCQLDRSAFEHIKTLPDTELETVVKVVLRKVKSGPLPNGILTKKLVIEFTTVEKLEPKQTATPGAKLSGPIVAPVSPPAAKVITPVTPSVSLQEPQLPQPTPKSPAATPVAPTIPLSVAPTHPSKSIESRIEIIKNFDTEDRTEGGIEGFSKYFRDRFQKQTQLFKVRPDTSDAGTISDALKANPNQKIKFVAMIMEKRARGERLFLDVDDLESKATVMVSEKPLLDWAQSIPPDQVICVSGVKARGDLIVAKEITLPDIPEHRPNFADEEVWAVLLSDLHVGSNKFLPDALTRVFDWLSGRVGSPEQRHIAERVKYVIVCGDMVDGIGVYPRQEKELAIPDLYDQYKAAAKYFAMIPDSMDVIMLPGNHDAVRQALPQPPIPKSFSEPILESRAVTSLSNPTEFTLHGVRMFEHHGRSLDDVIAGVPNLNYYVPEKAMKLQLQCRHVASEYGNRTSIAPWENDRLVIENVPDVFQSGHIHIAKCENYRGTQIVNSGAWQAQTDFQKRLNLVPTPGILMAVNLQTVKIKQFNFLQKDDEVAGKAGV